MICSACGQVMTPFLQARDYNRGVSAALFHYERCSGCGLASLTNIPSDIGRYYTGYHDVPSTLAELARAAKGERYKMDLVCRFASGGHLLDIGASRGSFCFLAKEAGFEVEAIEMDARCCDFIRSEIGVRAIQSADPASAILNAATPDVITIWQVIEHMPEPWKVLEAAASKLVHGGVLIVATPNPLAAQFSLFGKFWAHLDAPRHIHLVPASLLTRRMERLGFVAELITTTDAGGLACNDFGWRCSMANVSPVESIKSALRLAGRFMALLAAPVDRARGKGSAYTAVFRKAE